MKKFICIITAVLTFFASAPFNLIPQTVKADYVYARIITTDTPFYKNADDTLPLFFLPYTYYVKILGVKGEFTHVECYGDGNTATIDGFVPTAYLYEDGLPVENPFVVLELTTVDTTVLYEDAMLSVQSQYVFANRSMQYYGSYLIDGETVYFVGYNNRLGYVKEQNVFPFSIPNHPNELTFLTPDSPNEQPTETITNSGENFFGIKVAVIVCLLFAGIIALFVALSKKPTQNPVAFYDDNDYQ